MYTDYLCLGSTPCEEDCAQVGDINYKSRAKKEMNLYIDQLYRMFPDAEDNNVSFRTKWQSHDFGSYGEVAAVFLLDDEKSVKFAFHVEENQPSNWDDESLKIIKGEIMKFDGEICYEMHDGNVHSDICFNCDGKQSTYKVTEEHRKFLHDCLNEWLDNSRGTGAFWVGDSDYFLNWEEK